jgi:lysozyme family protein
MEDRERLQFEIENRKLDLESEKTRLDYRKFVLGSVFVAIAIAAIPPLFQLATAALEYVKSEAALKADQQNKAAERTAKQAEFRELYIKEFLSNALNQDVELRIRFAEYFSHVSTDTVRDDWVRYRDNLLNARNAIREDIDKLEEAWWAVAQTPRSFGNPEQERLERILAWKYKEVGYVERNRSVTANPRIAATETSSQQVVTNRTPSTVEYESLYRAATINQDARPLVQRIVDKMESGKLRYLHVAQETKVPWYVIAILHHMENSLRFDQHLLTGDPLSDRTVREPKGRPKEGVPPFTWEQSAIDAWKYILSDRDWGTRSVGATLMFFERLNGLGYRIHGVPSPYLWTATNVYIQGKMVAAGVFSPEFRSAQIGVVALLKTFEERGTFEATFETEDGSILSRQGIVLSPALRRPLPEAAPKK